MTSRSTVRARRPPAVVSGAATAETWSTASLRVVALWALHDRILSGKRLHTMTV